MKKVERALISLTDKSGIEGFATELDSLGIEILSTGGTANKIRDYNIPVVDVSDFTGFPEMLDGRVKTLHPKVHGGILFDRLNDDHVQQCRVQQIEQIDIVAVNLYAFEKTVSAVDCRLMDAIENIDIGGPTLLRAAAKNFRSVTVIVDPDDYSLVLEEIKTSGNTTLATRFNLAAKVFSLTNAYDKAIADWMAGVDVVSDPFFKGEK